METVKIIHPVTGSIAAVPASSVKFHYRAGWRLLAEGEEQAAKPIAEPAPMTRAEASKAKAASKKTATEPAESEAAK